MRVRLKIILALVFGGLLVAWFLIFPKQQTPTKEKQIPVFEDNNFTNSIRLNKTSRVELTTTTNPTKQVINSMDDRIIELTELGARSDAKSFQKLVTNLSDAEPEIRQAALEAIIQFGNREAIPILKDLAAKTEDTQEKINILEAAKFLELPSLTEIRARRGTNSSFKPVKREK